MTDYTIAYLADYPQHAEACAAWIYGRWGVQNPNKSLKETINTFKESAQKDKIPLTLVALDNNGLPIGTGTLHKDDGDTWNEYTPWITMIFTHFRREGKGIATSIIRQLEQKAKELGHSSVYLKAGSADRLYKKLNYTEIETIKTNISSVGYQTLFKKDLSQ